MNVSTGEWGLVSRHQEDKYELYNELYCNERENSINTWEIVRNM